MNETYDFVKVCKLLDLQEGKGKRFFVNDVDVAVFKIDGVICALSNVCPHKQSTIIYDGFVEDGKVTCPAHGWEFELKTGNLASGGKGLDKYEVKIENEFVYVKAIPKNLAW